MKILLADKLPDESVEQLRQSGFDVTSAPKTSADELPKSIADHAVLVVRSTRVSAATIEAGKKLGLIVRAGAGINTIDVQAASAHGIFVANCPGQNAIAVAELTLGLLLALDRRIPQANADLKAGHWNKGIYSKANGLFGITYGVVGAGTIGRAVIARAQAMGMNVVAWSRSLSESQAQQLGVVRADSPLELAKKCDAVSVHLAFCEATKGLIDKDFLKNLGPGGMLVNTSRGGIVEETAVLDALQNNGLRYATDVFDNEPANSAAPTDLPLALHAETIVTPHIGASTQQAQNAVASEAVHIIESFGRTGIVPNCVNLRAESPAKWILNVRHHDRIGVLASVLGAVREAGINVAETENILFREADTACARIRLHSEPPDELQHTISQTEHVIDANVTKC